VVKQIFVQFIYLCCLKMMFITHTARETVAVGRLLVVIVEGANLCTGEDGMNDLNGYETVF
jgi:hypothetical protein